MSTSEEITELPASVEADVQWRSWLLAQRPLVAVAAGVGLPALAAIVTAATGSFVLACLALAAVAMAAWRAMVPIEFAVDDGGIKQRWLQRRSYDAWISFAAFSRLPHGFMLWRVADPCPLNAADGLFLPQPPRETDLLVILRRHLVEIS